LLAKPRFRLSYLFLRCSHRLKAGAIAAYQSVHDPHNARANARATSQVENLSYTKALARALMLPLGVGRSTPLDIPAFISG